MEIANFANLPFYRLVWRNRDNRGAHQYHSILHPTNPGWLERIKTTLGLDEFFFVIIEMGDEISNKAWD